MGIVLSPARAWYFTSVKCVWHVGGCDSPKFKGSATGTARINADADRKPVYHSLSAQVLVALLPRIRFLTYLRAELTIVLATTSSGVMSAQIMRRLERLGVKDSVAGLMIPTGYSRNPGAFSIHLTLAVVFMAQATRTRRGILMPLRRSGPHQTLSPIAAGSAKPHFAPHRVRGTKNDLTASVPRGRPACLP